MSPSPLLRLNLDYRVSSTPLAAGAFGEVYVGHFILREDELMSLKSKPNISKKGDKHSKPDNKKMVAMKQVPRELLDSNLKDTSSIYSTLKEMELLSKLSRIEGYEKYLVEFYGGEYPVLFAQHSSLSSSL